MNYDTAPDYSVVITVIVIALLLMALIGGLIGARKGKGSTGALLGFFLGIIGIIIVLCLEPTREELIRRERERLAIQQAIHQPSMPPDWP